MALVQASVLILLSLCGLATVQAQFRVLTSDELEQLPFLTDKEKLLIAARTGEMHIVELSEMFQGAVVQEDVTLSIDCLPWLQQNPEGSMIRWTFIQLDEFGNVEDPDRAPQELPRNDFAMPPARIIVGGEFNRWLNITRTVIIQGAEDPDSRIFMCEVCQNVTTLEGCSSSNYTQLTVGSPPMVLDTSEQRCISRDMDSKVVELDCIILNSPQPSPLRSWFKDGELVYSTISGLTVDPNDFLMDNPILVPGVLDPSPFTALGDGRIFYNYDIMNISVPSMLPPGTTLEQATQEVFDLLIGNWTCLVNNTLGSSTVTYVIRECERTISFEMDNYTVIENEGFVEVCIVSTDLTGIVDVEIAPVTKEVDNPAAASDDFDDDVISISFNTSLEKVCFNIPIIGDIRYEGNEQFLVTFGNLPNSQAEVGFIEQACVTIVDDEIPEFTITPSVTTVSEDDPSVEVCISSNTVFARDVAVTAETGPKSGALNQATADFDYQSTEVSLTFVPSDTTPQEFCRNISIIDDNVNELPEQFVMRLLSASPEGTFIQDTSCITIVDNEPPQFTITPKMVTVNESDGEVELCVTSVNPLSGEIVVTAQTLPKMDATAPALAGSDYESDTFTLGFSPGDENPTQCFNVKIVNDLISELTEQFSVKLISATPEGSFIDDTSCISIIDDDPIALPVPRFTITPITVEVNESDPEVELCVVSDIPLNREVVVTAQTQSKDGATAPATAGIDYEQEVFMLTFTPTDGTLIMMRCFNVKILEDSIDELDEQFSVKLISALPEGSFIEDTSCITIIDNDLRPIPRFTITPKNVVVNESNPEVELCVSSDMPISSEITVTAQTQAKEGASFPATAGMDYVSNTFMLTFSPSENIEMQCFKVGIINDEVIELTEQFSVKLISATPEGSFIDDTSCISIIDNDPIRIPVCNLNARLINVDGEFVCVCNDGYEGDGRVCTDINECKTQGHACHIYATCVNTDGSFTCTCNAGFTGNGKRCVDIDECWTGENNCDPLNAKCVNKLGSFKCFCKYGFQGDGVNCVSNFNICDEDVSTRRTTRRRTTRSRTGTTGRRSSSSSGRGPCGADDVDLSPSSGSTPRAGTRTRTRTRTKTRTITKTGTSTGTSIGTSTGTSTGTRTTRTGTGTTTADTASSISNEPLLMDSTPRTTQSKTPKTKKPKKKKTPKKTKTPKTTRSRRSKSRG